MARSDKRVVWSPKARQYLRDIWRYFTEVATRDIADRLLREIALASQRLAERPLIGRPREEVMPGLRSIRIHPYSLLYRVTDERIEVARVLHERRNVVSAFQSEKR